MFARYYNSATGRFLSPDWDAKSSDPVPYAKLDDPQSLNLYSYVRNNPLSRTDPDGHVDDEKKKHHHVKKPKRQPNRRVHTKLTTVKQMLSITKHLLSSRFLASRTRAIFTAHASMELTSITI